MEKYIPAEVTQAEKQGFSGPDASWFKGDSINYVRHLLSDGRARIYELLDQEAVRRLVEEHLQGKQNRRLFIWSLLNVEWWLRKFMPKGSSYDRLRFRFTDPACT
jgi:asparagine synthase (glutamine-hydrolysing)